MAKFGKAVITDVGKRGVADLIVGNEEITFTKIQTSSTSVPDNLLRSLESLTNVKQETIPSNVSRLSEDPDTVEVNFAITNLEITIDYTINTVGLFIKGMDDEDVLFAVFSATSGVLIPAFGVNNSMSTSIGLRFKMSADATVSFAVSPDVLITHQEFEAALAEQDEINQAKADDGQVVKLNGDQAVLGEKDFEILKMAGEIVATLGMLPVNPANDDQVVHTTKDEAIVGKKNFTDLNQNNKKVATIDQLPDMSRYALNTSVGKIKRLASWSATVRNGNTLTLSESVDAYDFITMEAAYNGVRCFGEWVARSAARSGGWTATATNINDTVNAGPETGQARMKMPTPTTLNIIDVRAIKQNTQGVTTLVENTDQFIIYGVFGIKFN
ncbi:hypothetical protein EQG49_12880 [Periweissella cryptocerci]|uniref:Phage tail protein n=1 Tax=Periweissella cryptocerci TaxID=2506420 RepID=A0A4P6YWV7_9LACO|nr:hypothetical protein [Periweissella cryptocerci]QBO37291.1 hypothetical protein EQG49_12880 [Periweissella cryptocerci]